MKYLFLSAALCLSLTIASSQNVIEKHFQTYQQQEDITEVFVSGQLFQMAAVFVDNADFEDLEEIGVQDAKEFILSIESFQLIKVPELQDAEAIYRNGLSKIQNSHDELVMVRDNDSHFSLHVSESGGRVTELVGMGTDDGEFIVFSLLGDMDFESLGKIVTKIQSENLTKSKVVQELDIDEMKIYPNPASTDGLLNIEVPESMIGGTAKLYDLNGSVVQQFTIQGQQQQLQAEGLTPGYYVVELQKDAVTMKKKVLVAK